MNNSTSSDTPRESQTLVCACTYVMGQVGLSHDILEYPQDVSQHVGLGTCMSWYVMGQVELSQDVLGCSQDVSGHVRFGTCVCWYVMGQVGLPWDVCM